MQIDTYTSPLGDFTPSVVPMMEPSVAVTTPIIAQQFEDNLFERTGDILNGFVESGQVWALLIGVVLGYALRGLTTY